MWVAVLAVALAQPPEVPPPRPVAVPPPPRVPVQPLPPPVLMPPPPVPRPAPVFPFPIFFICFMPAVIAAHQRQQQNAEEEELMPPDAIPPSYEYKILRSGTGALKTPAKRQAALAEEGAAGWELYEVLDCSRVRVRRDTTWRATDADRPGDPYRTRVGATEGQVALRVVLVIVAILVAVGLAVALVLAIK